MNKLPSLIWTSWASFPSKKCRTWPRNDQKWKPIAKLISHNVLLCTFTIFLFTNCAKCDSSLSSSRNLSSSELKNNSIRPNVRQKLVLYSLKMNSTSNSSTSSSSPSTSKTQTEDYKVNTRNLERVSRMIHNGQMKSACSISGLWAIFYSQDFQNVAAVLYASSNSDDQTCTQNQLNETNYAQYKSIRYVGNSNLLEPGLSLYRGPFFSLEELYFNGHVLSLPSSQTFHSYGFTGNDSWTLYKNTNFSGPAICLMAYGGNYEDIITNTFDRVIYNKNKGVDFVVGSIQKGCTEQSNRTLIFPSGETVVQWTNKPLGYENRSENNLEVAIHRNELPSLKLISEIDGNILTTDAVEMRLPEKYTFNRFILNTGKNSTKDSSTTTTLDETVTDEEENIAWTVFSGLEFTGKTKCFQSKLNNNEDLNNDDEIETFDFRVPFRQDIFLVGSIKFGCFEGNETEDLPVLELHLSENDYEGESDPDDSIFFTSFIIGLVLLVIVILLSIATIIYFYVRTKRKEKKQERLSRAMRS